MTAGASCEWLTRFTEIGAFPFADDRPCLANGRDDNSSS